MIGEKEKQIIEILKNVKDPETEIDIVSSGYIYGMTVTDEKTEIWMDFNQRVPGCSFCKVIAWKIIETISTNVYKELEKNGYKNIKVVEAANPKIVYKQA